MRFTMTNEGALRLGLDPSKVCIEFNGTPTREGLLGGVPRGVLRWAKEQLKVDRVEYLDIGDSRLLYYVIAMRAVDHTLLPIDRFDELALTDFELIRHEVTTLDQDGDCGECSMPLEASVHTRTPDGPGTGVPPTEALDGEGITATATP